MKRMFHPSTESRKKRGRCCSEKKWCIGNEYSDDVHSVKLKSNFSSVHWVHWLLPSQRTPHNCYWQTIALIALITNYEGLKLGPNNKEKRGCQRKGERSREREVKHRKTKTMPTISGTHSKHNDLKSKLESKSLRCKEMLPLCSLSHLKFHGRIYWRGHRYMNGSVCA